MKPLPTHIAALAAMDQHHPPQPAKPMPKDLQLRHVTLRRRWHAVSGVQLVAGQGEAEMPADYKSLITADPDRQPIARQ